MHYRIPWLFFGLLSVKVFAIPRSCSLQTTDLDGFLSTKYDYIVVGGGTAGVAVASRLAESGGLNIGVIEAGDFHLNDAIVDTPGFAGQGIGNQSLDWGFLSVPQPSLESRNILLSRGKLLGGSSGLNLLAFGRGSKPEYDAWKTFISDSGWDWNSLLPFFEKSESVAKVPENPFANFTLDPKSFLIRSSPRSNGLNGPVAVSFDSIYAEPVPTVVQTLNSLGIKTNMDPRDGNATGLVNSLLAIDRSSGLRSYSPIGYICNQQQKSNLHILTGAQATKVLLQKTKSGIQATGVSFNFKSQSYNVTSSREVILSAGSIQTPQLLELSGIGNASVLANAGIQTLINLPGVGENFQEQPFQIFVDDQLQTFFGITQLFFKATGTGLLAQQDATMAFFPLESLSSPERVATLIELFDNANNTGAPNSLQSLQSVAQRTWLKSSDVASAELIFFSRGLVDPQPGESYITMLAGIMHPASRGSTHINSSDPLAPPVINPQLLSKDFGM
ncbi:GMC oxidoreductase-domain-containing protein [Cyathus striatus]|nr:GMC oxidoreductase-domain-containing protein [Cyathus striatus]